MDIISQLSDDLLLRILSCVPTKDVVATSLLSKRWWFLWILTPQLEFDDSNHNGDYKSFSHFVYRSLLSNKAPFLEYLHLNLGADCPFIDIGLWIDIAISSCVRELEINIYSSEGGEPFSLPCSLYTSDTLETLKLRDFVFLNVPFSVRLPSLKILSLKLLDYVDNESLPSLLTGCPNLEELFLERHSKDTKDVTVVVPSLQRLSVIDKNSGTCGRFVIDVSSLKYLTIKDKTLYNFHKIENMPELVEAHVEITHEVTQKFLKALTSVHRLSLCLSLSEVMHPSGMIFNKLVYLELYTITEGWWDLLTCMLEDSPKLRFLKLIHKHDSGDSGKEASIGWKPPSSVPECLLSSLEAFEWIGYKGRLGDREMTTYILKNAACLKTATFSPISTDVGEKYQMLKELASLPKSATSSQLLFD